MEKIEIPFMDREPMPQLHFLIHKSYIENVKREISSILEKINITEFALIEICPTEIKNPNEWMKFLVTIDWIRLSQVLGLVSSLINIGNFFHKALNFLRKLHKREVRKVRINCTASVTMALNHLQSISAAILANGLRLIFLKMLAFHCIAIFASPPTHPKEIHVIISRVDRGVSSYSNIKL